MATAIKLKKSAIAGRVPVSGDLEYGELAINYNDGVLYFKNTSNNVKRIAASSLGVDSNAVIDLVDSAYVDQRLPTDLVTLADSQELTNKTLASPTVNSPVFGSGSNSPTFTEIRFNNSNIMKFNQMYTGASNGSYFTNGEYQKVVTITPDGNSQNYQVVGRITAQNAGETHTVYFNAALRSQTLPDLNWSITYHEEYTGNRYLDPQLWTKETTTAAFIFAFKTLATIYGTVTVDFEVIPRSSTQLDNVSVNAVQNSEQTSVDTGFTARDMTRTHAIIGSNVRLGAYTFPTADGSANQVLGTNGSGTLSFVNQTEGLDSAAANAIIDSSVNKAFVDNLDVNAGTLDGQDGTYYLNYNNFTNTPSIPDSAFVSGIAADTTSPADSSSVTSIVDSNYIQQFIDTTYVATIVDSAYVAVRTGDFAENFGTVAIVGDLSIDATTGGDTVTFAAGTGVTLASDVSNKRITISAQQQSAYDFGTFSTPNAFTLDMGAI